MPRKDRFLPFSGPEARIHPSLFPVFLMSFFTLRNTLVPAMIILMIVIVTFIYTGAHLFAPGFSISSTAFADNGMIPVTYTCEGDGKSPPLAFSNIPKNAQTIALYIFDQDAPKNGFVHWVVYDISPETGIVEEGKIPAGSVEGLNGTQKVGYQPLCPPTGIHRYLFTAYALSDTYHFVKVPDIDKLKSVMKGDVIAKAQLTGKYGHSAVAE